jgi:hypothetical protein
VRANVQTDTIKMELSVYNVMMVAKYVELKAFVLNVIMDVFCSQGKLILISKL